MTSTKKNVILFIGDSFATQRATDLLDKALKTCCKTSAKNYQVERAGYPGLGLAHFLPEVRKEIERLRPDIVVHIYPDTDALRHYALIKRMVFPSPRRAAKGWWYCWQLTNRLKRIHAVIGDVVWQLMLSTILRELDIRKGLEKDRELFREFAEFLGSRGIRYIVCLWDIEYWGLTSRFRRTLEFLNNYDHVIFLSDLNKHLSLFHEWEYKIPNDGHPNELGNRLMAQYIVEKGLEAGYF
jgi:hypothetical protein